MEEDSREVLLAVMGWCCLAEQFCYWRQQSFPSKSLSKLPMEILSQ